MKNRVTVRKNRAQRFGLWVLFIFFFAIDVGCTIWLQQFLSALIFLPWILIMFAMLLYYETWQISFLSDTIKTKKFLFYTRSYSYHQIVDVVESYSVTNHGYVAIIFANSKKIRFRLEDENANKAVRIIQSHHSIRSMN